MDCWEFKKCGREKGGIKEHELGSCNAYPNHSRHCARVAGTLCGGKVQGMFAQKLGNCLNCEYYKTTHYDKTYGHGKLDPLAHQEVIGAALPPVGCYLFPSLTDSQKVKSPSSGGTRSVASVPIPPMDGIPGHDRAWPSNGCSRRYFS